MRQTIIRTDRAIFYYQKEIPPTYCKKGELVSIAIARTMNGYRAPEYDEEIQIIPRSDMKIETRIHKGLSYLIYKDRKYWYRISNGVKKKLKTTELIGELL